MCLDVAVTLKKYEDFMLRAVDHLMSGTQDSNAGANLLGGEFVLGSTPESLVEKYDRLSQHAQQLTRKLEKREKALMDIKERVARKKQESLTQAAKLNVDFRMMRTLRSEAQTELQGQDQEVRLLHLRCLLLAVVVVADCFHTVRKQQSKQLDVEKMRQLAHRKIKT